MVQRSYQMNIYEISYTKSFSISNFNISIGICENSYQGGINENDRLGTLMTLRIG